MTLNDEDMDTFVFAVGTKKAMARLQKEMQDLVNILYKFYDTNWFNLKLNLEINCYHNTMDLLLDLLSQF